MVQFKRYGPDNGLVMVKVKPSHGEGQAWSRFSLKGMVPIMVWSWSRASPLTVQFKRYGPDNGLVMVTGKPGQDSV